MRTENALCAIAAIALLTASLQAGSLLSLSGTRSASGNLGAFLSNVNAGSRWRKPRDTLRLAIDKIVREPLPPLRSDSDRKLLSLAECGNSLLTALSDSLKQRVPSSVCADLLSNVTFATNTADKLVYQLNNFEPLRMARLSEPQWNPPRHQEKDGNVRLVVGLSSVERKKNYLADTLRNFFRAMNDNELHDTVIIVFNANVPISDHSDIPLVRKEFQREISRGSLRIVTRNRPDTVHEELQDPSRLAHRWGDDDKRIWWRSKQVLDVAWLMDYVSTSENLYKSGYFLMMEDDILAAKSFPTKVRSWVDQRLYGRTDWMVASFYNPWEGVANEATLPPYKFFGVIGQLFRMHDLPVVVEFLRKNFDQSPLDWLMVDFLKKFNGQMIVHSPSYFQHQGEVSSLEGKRQSGRSVDFEEES